VDKKFEECFAGVEDPRAIRNQKHPFMMLVGTTLLAHLAGIDSFSGISDFVEAHEEYLERYFEFPHGVPSHDTYQRLWDGIKSEQFVSAFMLFSESLATLHGANAVLSIDGKTIRNSGEGKSLHIVSAWCEANQLVLAQQKVAEKSNEISAIPRLLELLDIKSRIVTIDAMGAQREICDKIIGQEGDYVISLKGNQGTLHRDIKEYFEDELCKQECSSFIIYDKGHGRLEERTAYVTGQLDWLQIEHKWPGLKSIGMVISKVTKGDKTTNETRYYISSLAENAELLNQAARSHWAIENKLHWRLDVVFNEDKACIRNDNSAENIDILRKWALNILHRAKDKPSQSLKSVMRKNSMSFKHLLKSVNKIFHA
jgi:predicted transposase YbfD/YdcC